MNSAYEPIAIVGIGCRFPGGIDTPQSFWDFLVRGGDGTCEVPESRWNLDRYYDPTPGKPGKVYTKRGGFLGDVVNNLPFFDEHRFLLWAKGPMAPIAIWRIWR